MFEKLRSIAEMRLLNWLRMKAVDQNSKFYDLDRIKQLEIEKNILLKELLESRKENYKWREQCQQKNKKS